MGVQYRLSVDYSLADQVVGDNGKVAFVQSVKITDSTGAAVSFLSGVAQGSTTSGQTGVLSQGAVTTAAPAYTTGQTDPLSLTTSGDLRTVFSNTTIAVTQATASNLNAQVVGNVADGAANSGNPVAVAGVFNSTFTPATTGQRTVFRTDQYGNMRAVMTGGASAGADGSSNSNTLSVASVGALPGTLQPLTVAGYIFNGTSNDRMVKANATSRLLSSAATTNGTSAKASAGNAFMMTGRNAAATLIYLKVYNKASAPTVGTDTPAQTFALSPQASFALDWANGRYFGTGIAYAFTTGSADADTGAVGAGDILGFNLDYS